MFFPQVSQCQLPSFDSNGVIIAGDFWPTTQEFEDRFVNVGDITKRKSIYDGWNRHRADLFQAGSLKTNIQLLNGSFTTNKYSPGDIDIAVEVSIQDSTASEFFRKKAISDLLQGPRMKPKYQCDAYPIYCLPPDHKDYKIITGDALSYWTKWFGHCRPPLSHLAKGRIWATIGGLR
jgi:hypothetical protein